VAVHILPVVLTTEKESRGEEERCVIPTTMNRLTPTYYHQNTTSPFVFPPSVELVIWTDLSMVPALVLVNFALSNKL
jgi:hypothetical protein